LRRHSGLDLLVRLVLVVAAALIDADGRVLLAQRPKGKALEGLWEFPGGKVDAGEGPEDALIRELMEELGITVKADCLAPLTFASHAYDDFHLLMPLYVCRRWEGFVQPLDGQALKWVRPGALRDYPMPPADEPPTETLPGSIRSALALSVIQHKAAKVSLRAAGNLCSGASR